MTDKPKKSSGLLGRHAARLGRMKGGRWLTFLLMVAAVGSAVFTYLSLTRDTGPYGPDPRTVLSLLLTSFVLMLALGVVVFRRAFQIWNSLRRGATGSQLQRRILIMFSLLTIVPALMVSVFATLFFHVGIQSWFHDRVNTALEESVAVASAYLQEHREIIRSDALSMGNDLDREMHRIMANPALLGKIVNSQAAVRSLTEGIVIQRNRIIAQTPLSFALAFERVETEQQERANAGEVVVWVGDEDKLRALVRLHSIPDTYLLIGRLIDERVVQHMDEANGAVAEYRRLKANADTLQIQFSLIFGVVVLLLLLMAMWYGMRFANRLVIPITRLIKASERVSAGNFNTKVPLSGQDDELATLGRAFNQMTGELQKQRTDLVDANRQLDERRRFSEAVLAGVSAGIVALDADKRVTLYNRTALALLPLKEENLLTGSYIWDALPALKSLLHEAESTPDKLLQHELTLAHMGKNRTLLMRITVERYAEMVEGYILTFDDITELVAAQRNAAWSDVARRVAHEIKNPLTPIQLSAERLRRKYSKQITDGQESYDRYIDTITRHVGEIGRMVEEFVSFARMPTPVFAKEKLSALVRKVVFSEQVAHPNIRYQFEDEAEDATILGDANQLSRVIGNLMKNAAEAIERDFETGKVKEKPRGTILISLRSAAGHLRLSISDDGPGFPEDKLAHLVEPYVTTREKGTGLGLSIVQKIVEDHGGEMLLANIAPYGARVTLTFAVDSDKNVT